MVVVGDLVCAWTPCRGLVREFKCLCFGHETKAAVSCLRACRKEEVRASPESEWAFAPWTAVQSSSFIDVSCVTGGHPDETGLVSERSAFGPFFNLNSFGELIGARATRGQGFIKCWSCCRAVERLI